MLEVVGATRTQFEGDAASFYINQRLLNCVHLLNLIVRLELNALQILHLDIGETKDRLLFFWHGRAILLAHTDDACAGVLARTKHRHFCLVDIFLVVVNVVATLTPGWRGVHLFLHNLNF